MTDRITRMVISIQADGLYLIATEAGPIMSADSLTRDEALGCIASWIYGHRDHGTVPQFMQTPEMREEYRRWQEGMVKA
ncbi:MAG TPA: hypothetical protein DCS97_06835 [Planctomycetes bacterium]|nr:hypothetical protein [Planctomycetota bacterium]